MTVLSLPRQDAAEGVEGPAERIVDAALRCVGRWGLGKTTLDDIAREAGCARATVYRLFPGGRDALWSAVVATEASRFFRRIAERAAAQDGLEDVVVVLVTESAAILSGHAALEFLFAHEPEAILPHLAFHRMNGLFALVGAFAGPLLAPWLADGSEEEAARAAEWLARVVISYLTSPSPDVNLLEESSARSFVRTFILPGLCRARPACASI